MIPKCNAAKMLLEKGTKAVHLIDGRKEHSFILDTFTQSERKL